MAPERFDDDLSDFDYRRYGWYRPSRPRPAKGGIRARSRSGAFGKSWWAQRWTQVLEGYQIGARLRRGRSYARQGQVLSIDIEKGKVAAVVQGSRRHPYQVALRISALGKHDWRKLAKVVVGRADYAARLLRGEMPEEIEEAFAAADLTLFPRRRADLRSECSCPDWSNPCKHIAAVYYLLGEEFDRDPFLIFKLRGLGREELVQLLGGRATRRPGARRGRKAAPPQPLARDATRFWQGEEIPADLHGEVRVPRVAAPLLRRLGGFPFWRGDEPLLDALAPTYARSAQDGLALFLGEQEPDPTPPKPAARPAKQRS